MEAKAASYKCPACTGPLHFDPDTGKLSCDYCGTQFEVEEIERLHAEEQRKAEENAASAQQAEEMKFQSEAADDGDGAGGTSEEDFGKERIESGMKAYSCPSCGAELVCDETTAATSCPYCGNPTIIPEKFVGMLKPDYVIPFKLEKEEAIEALKSHYKGKLFLPKTFSKENHIEEIKGLYVPFWLFDGDVKADATFRGERVFTHTEGDYEVTTTDHYRLLRSGSMSFGLVPVDGSSKMPDDHMDAIEPFDYSEMKPFSTAYLPGYLADKYDVDENKSLGRAKGRMSGSMEDALRDTASTYVGVRTENLDIDIDLGKAKYALFPVWVLNTKWKNKNFLFTMNGQTGKMIGDLPVSWGKFWGFFAGISLPLMAIFGVIAAFV